MMDVQSPYAFYPAQCIHTSAKDQARGRYNSPIIGYLRKGSAVEDDLIGQLSALFKAQRDNGAILGMAASNI
jgi:hypothetical protein